MWLGRRSCFFFVSALWLFSLASCWHGVRGAWRVDEEGSGLCAVDRHGQWLLWIRGLMVVFRTHLGELMLRPGFAVCFPKLCGLRWLRLLSSRTACLDTLSLKSHELKFEVFRGTLATLSRHSIPN